MQLDQKWRLAQGDDAPLLHWIDTAYRDPLPKKIGIAVSGGGDSMALLHLFMRWAARTGHPIAAVTVDHGLRAEAAKEAADVAAFCAGSSIPHDTLTWTDWDGHGNLQAAARDARYRLMTDWAHANGVGGIVLGHTKDDSAETFIMRMSRKAGIDGLSLMARDFERDGIKWVRPLWMTTRAELRDYLRRNDAPWVDDPSNDDVDFHRIRVRKALNLLDDLGVTTDALHHTAFVASQARAALEHYTAQEAKTHVRQESGDLILPEKPDPMVPAEVLRRLQAKVIQWLGHSPYPPRSAAMRHLTSGLALEGRHTLGGCHISLKDGMMRFTREANAVRQAVCASDEIWDRHWQIDGPHAPDLEIRALGEGIRDCPDWRATGLPRASLLSSPAIWRGETLVAAPLAGFNDAWNAQIVADFHSSLLTH